MSSKIGTKQNCPEALDVLRAARAAYGNAKGLGRIQLGLPLLAAGAGAVAPHLAPAAVAYVALVSAAIPLIDYIFLEPRALESHATGAKLQEEFDAFVMSFPWKVRQRVDPELRHELTESCRETPDAPLKDWYPPEIDELPLQQARLICQRSNMQWDARLRRYVWQGYTAALVVTIVAAVAYGFWRHLGTDAWGIEVVTPVAPLCLRLARKLDAHRTAAEKSERAKRDIGQLWSRSLEGSLTPMQLDDETRATQEDLFDRRLRSPQVPDFIHKRKRAAYEAQMKVAATAMVAEAREAVRRSASPSEAVRRPA